MLRAPLRPISRAFHAMPPLRRKLSEPERVETVARFAARGWTDKFPERDAVEKTYEFKDFSQAWGFMSRVALWAEKRDHHPLWTNVYNKVTVLWETHDVGGLGTRDVEAVEVCDKVAEEIGNK